jgi:hypothetical protein
MLCMQMPESQTPFWTHVLANLTKIEDGTTVLLQGAVSALQQFYIRTSACFALQRCATANRTLLWSRPGRLASRKLGFSHFKGP